MAKKALVTGCNGFVGGYLCGSLLKDGYAVSGIDLQDGPKDSGVEYRQIDLYDSPAVIKAFGEFGPDEVYHLAAVANPRAAKESPELAYKTSVLSTLALMEAGRAFPRTKILIVGSSEEYKKRDGAHLEFSETDELDAATVYGSSKVVAEMIAKAYCAQYGVKAFFTRSFNHTGPGQAPVYVLSDFARQCAMIKLGRQAPELVTGNIDLKRDFLDVRDVVDAYRRILAKGRPGATYNVASGDSISLRECVESMLEGLGLAGVSMRTDPARLREGEPDSLVGDPSLIGRDTGWAPRFDIRKTTKELALDWADKLSAEGNRA